MLRLILPRLIILLMILSIGGLLFCRLVDVIFFHNGSHLDQTTIGLWILRCFGIIFGFTVLILVPLEIVINRPVVKEVRKLWAEGEIDPKELSPLRQFLFYSNYANVPKWVYLPFVILAYILAGFLAIGLVILALLCLAWVTLHLWLYILHFLGH
jgi:hypothetical protein